MKKYSVVFYVFLERWGIWASIVAMFMAGRAWVVRNIITNNKKIALLEQDLQRGREDQKEMKDDIKKLLERK